MSIESLLEQTRVQLAGCGVAALDGSKAQEAKKGDYGWSPAYADVLRLRRQADKWRSALREIESVGMYDPEEFRDAGPEDMSANEKAICATLGKMIGIAQRALEEEKT